MQKLEPHERTKWKEAPALGRGITIAYARSALRAIDAARQQHKEE